MLTGDFQFYQKSLMANNPLWRSVTDCFNEDRVDGYDVAEAYCEQNDPESFKNVSKTIAKQLLVLRGIEK